MQSQKQFKLLWIIVPFLFLLIGCEPPPAVTPTTVSQLNLTLLSITDASQIGVNRPFSIKTAASDPDGIDRVEFLVDGILVDIKETEFSTTYFEVTNEWIPPIQKTYQITVVAYSKEQKPSSPVKLTQQIVVTSTIAEVKEATPTTIYQPTPTERVSCTNDAILIADVTIADGTEIMAGQPFEKTWRIKNNGTCEWTTAYYFDWLGDSRQSSDVYIANLQMGANRQYLSDSVAVTKEIEITLLMQAPQQLGSYRSNWQMFDDKGQPFGKVFFVEIEVVP